MDYINEININEAVVHILDTAAEEPVLNEYCLELNEDVYVFLYKHIQKCFKDDDLKYCKFNYERNIVKEITQDYLQGKENNIIPMSQEIARQLFIIMKGNCNIPSGDLIVTSITTDQGPMIAILKMDYVKNFTHEIQFVEQKIGVNIIQQAAGLPNGKLQKAAFIKPIREGETYNIMVLDKQKASKEDEYGANYFVSTFLGASYVANERDYTKVFIKTSENWIRKSIFEDAAKAEEVRSTIKTKLKEEDILNVDELSEELFKDNQDEKESFATHIKMQCVAEEIPIDKEYVEKKLKRVRLNIDKEIDIYINEDAYRDESKFEVVKNGDGTINLVVKNVINYIEK